MSRERILLVEDERITAMAERELLQRLGYRVIATVATGEEAIRKAAEERPDLILMDISLQGEMHGIEAAETIRKQYDIPVIFVTAYARKDLVDRFEDAESCGYIYKPISAELLKSSIEAALNKGGFDERLGQDD